MAKASPAITSLNAGAWSILLEGRTDHERYNASTRRSFNGIATQQGPFISRSGTTFQLETYDMTKASHLEPFVFNEDDNFQLEFADFRVRILFDDGFQVRAPVACTAIVTLNPLRVTAAGHGAIVGEQIILNGLPSATNINGVALKVTNVIGNDIVLNYAYTGVVGVVAAQVSRVYHFVSPYAATDVSKIHMLQFGDIAYVFCTGYKMGKLSRRGAYDWTLELIDTERGPFMDETDGMGVLTLSSSDASLYADGSSSGVGVITFGTGNHADGLDADPATYWDSANDQTGILGVQWPAPVVLTGYVLYTSPVSSDPDYTAEDSAPGSWTFEGSNDGVSYTVLDRQDGYVLYQSGRSVHFLINNSVAYIYYRLKVTKCVRNGPIHCCVSKLHLTRGTPTIVLDLTLSGTYTGVNGGAGFLASDVGRLLRVKSIDNYYRIMKIYSRTDATHVRATLLDEPFLAPGVVAGAPDMTNAPILNWSIGYFSDTTGHPDVGTFFEDRLFVMCSSIPSVGAASRPGKYEDFEQKTATDVVLDDNAIVVRLNTRKLSDARWLETDEQGLVIGTGSNAWVITAANADNPITARNIKARPVSRIGVANVDPVAIGSDLLFVDVTERIVYKLGFVFQRNRYDTASLSLFASHLGISRFVQTAYANEPHSIMYFRREDGTYVGLTYNSTESVFGWHEHALTNAFVEDISVKPNTTTRKDELWLVVRRVVGGNTVRYIERLEPYWDFTSNLDNAQFVDSALRYIGPSVATLYGLIHLNGQTVSILFNGKVLPDQVVVNGSVALPTVVGNINVVVGISYISECEPSRIDAGAADGTAQGKVKRIHNCSLLLWDSAHGQIGKFNEQTDEYEFTDIEYKSAFDLNARAELKTEMVGPIIMPAGYEKRGAVKFRRVLPLPLNVISLLPQLNTQDR